MSLDRRILSILYHNGIVDVNKVEKFIGENNNYYEIMIDGKVEKLKIPGNKYDELSKFEIENQEKKEKISELLTNIVNPDGTPYIEQELVDKILKIDEEAKVKNDEEVKVDSFEEELKKTEIENTKFLEKTKEIEKEKLEKEKPEIAKPEVKKPEVKKVETKTTTNKAVTKAVKSKNLDNDIDDFIDIA